MLKKETKEYFNTDKRAQFTSKKFISILKSEKIKINMFGKGWEISLPNKWEKSLTFTVGEYKKSIGEFLQKYNDQRLYQSLKDTIRLSKLICR